MPQAPKTNRRKVVSGTGQKGVRAPIVPFPNAKFSLEKVANFSTSVRYAPVCAAVTGVGIFPSIAFTAWLHGARGLYVGLNHPGPALRLVWAL